MTVPLIHSMAEFASLILPCLDETKARDIAEIGGGSGGMSKLLAEHAGNHRGTLTCIDREPARGFAE